RFLDVEELADGDSIQKAIDTAFADEESNLQAGNVTLRGSGSVVPFVHFGVGDKLVWQSPPAMEKNDRRVQTISWSLGSGAVAEYEVQGSRVWGEASPLEAIIRLLDAPKKRRRPKIQRVGRDGGAAGAPVGAHIHLVRESAQSVDSAAPTAIEWDMIGVLGPRNFAVPAFPSTDAVIQEPGYYDVKVELGFDPD